MIRRSLLRSQLTKAWQHCIAHDYLSQRINSERSLQASFFSNLNTLLPENTRRVFVEPVMKATVPTANGATRKEIRYPDIVICNTKEVIGIVELKYQPRVQPNWKKDMRTFQWINKHRDQITIANVRFRGVETDGRKYKLSKDLLFVWAGVHAAWPSLLKEHLDPSLQDHFLELHENT